MLKDSVNKAKATAVKSYASLTHAELLEIGYCESLLESIKLLRKLMNRQVDKSGGWLGQDKRFCEEIRGKVMLGKL